MIITLNTNRVINIISNKNSHSRKTSDLLIEKLEIAGFSPSYQYNPKAILNICVGGDGSFLRAVRKNNFPTIPFVGVNTGNLGFFQEICPKQIDSFIDKYIKGDYLLEDTALVEAIVNTKYRKYRLTAVNEITIKGTKSKVVHLNVYIDGNHLQTFGGDGLIVSTPAGSTAYNFSTGGSVVYPTLNILQLTPISAINSQAYRSLPNSSIIPGDLVIKLKPTHRHKDSTLVLVDGEELKFKDVYDISLTLSDKKIKRIVLNKDMYWQNLKSKFL